jgi:hypothetical protein
MTTNDAKQMTLIFYTFCILDPDVLALYTIILNKFQTGVARKGNEIILMESFQSKPKGIIICGPTGIGKD